MAASIQKPPQNKLKGVECRTFSCTHIKVLKKEINTENIKITLDSNPKGTTISINYRPESPSGRFPNISLYENFLILKQICPLWQLNIKDDYSDEDLSMLTEYLAYSKAIHDFDTDKVDSDDMYELTKESDSSYTYTLYMPIINKDTAFLILMYAEEIEKKKHRMLTKFGIEHHKKLKEACKNGN